MDQGPTAGLLGLLPRTVGKSRAPIGELSEWHERDQCEPGALWSPKFNKSRCKANRN